MNNLDLVLKNCLLVNEGKQTPVDIGIKGDRIEKIASEITEDSNETLDLKGRYIAPGIYNRITKYLQDVFSKYLQYIL